MSKYNEWKNNIDLKAIGIKNNSANNASISERIVQFDILNKTPFECQQFLVTLQKDIINGTIQ